MVSFSDQAGGSRQKRNQDDSFLRHCSDGSDFTQAVSHSYPATAQRTVDCVSRGLTDWVAQLVALTGASTCEIDLMIPRHRFALPSLGSWQTPRQIHHLPATGKSLCVMDRPAGHTRQFEPSDEPRTALRQPTPPSASRSSAPILHPSRNLSLQARPPIPEAVVRRPVASLVSQCALSGRVILGCLEEMLEGEESRARTH